jgi:hypothetical protein
MPSVYRVLVSVQKYQFFETDEISFAEKTWSKLHVEEVGDSWTPPAVYVFRPKKKEGNFIGLLGGRVFAVANETLKSYPMLQTFFEQSGEILSLPHSGREFFVFNCTNCLNALDTKKAILSEAGTTVDKYAFLPGRFHFTLFTVPESNDLLCVEGMSAASDEFKGYVEENKLTGLIFEKLWSDEAV